MNPTRAVLRGIEPISLAKIMGFGYGVVGLIIGSIVSLVAFISPALFRGSNPVAAYIGFIGGVFSVILFPLLYGAIGFVSGFVAAAIYNWVAGRVGGIECQIDLSLAPPPQA